MAPLGDEASASDLFVFAFGYIVLATFGLWAVHHGFRALTIASASAFAKQGEWQAAVQPVLAVAKTQLEVVFGALAKVHVSIDTVLLFAILVALLGIWRSVALANELTRAEATPAASKKKAQ